MIFKKKEKKETEIQKEIQKRLKDIAKSRDDANDILSNFDTEIKDLIAELVQTTDPDEFKDILNNLERMLEAKKIYNSQLNDEIENLKKLAEIEDQVDPDKKRKIDPTVWVKGGMMLAALTVIVIFEKVHVAPKWATSIFSWFTKF